MSVLNKSLEYQGPQLPGKRSLVFQFIKTHNPHICILQETHLVGRRTLSLKKPWLGRHHHSTYSTFARGVSILVNKTIPFKLLDMVLDPDGRYIILNARINARIRRERRSALVRAESEASIQEALYVRTRDPQQYIRLQTLTTEVLSLRSSLTQKKLLAQSHFEQGERSGNLLAWLSREQLGGISVPTS